MEVIMVKMFRYSVKVWMFSFIMLASSAGSLFAVPPPQAPVFSALSMDGKSVGSSGLAGKAYIVNFFASWCPPCRAEIPDMVSLQNQYRSKGFTFIGVAVNETVPSISAFIKNNRISYPVVMADEQLVNSFGRYAEGGIRVIPTSFVVNSSGRITQVITGPRSRDAFEKIILDALRKPVKAK